MADDITGYETPAESVDVTLDAPAESQTPRAETTNLAASMAPEELDKIGATVIDDFQADFDSSTEFRERRSRQLRLYLGVLPNRAPDHDGAQVHLPLLQQAVLRTHARIYANRFPAKGGILFVSPIGPEDMDRAQRVTKHLNWQVRVQMPEYIPTHDSGMVQWLCYGSAFSYTYWNPVKRRPCVEFVPTDDIVLPYTRKSVDPSMGDVPRISRVLRLYKHEMQALERGGYYTNIAALYPEDPSNTGATPATASIETPVKDVADTAGGMKKAESNAGLPRELIEQHRWLALPGNPEERPVVVTVDKTSGKVLALMLREDEDPIDRARYEREEAARQASIEAMQQQHAQEMAAYIDAAQMRAQIVAGGMMGEGTDLGMDGEMPPPAMPEEPPPPKPPRMVPINFFTHYVCYPNPEGIYGLGLGSLLDGNNMAADTLMAQIIDSATLANVATGFFSRNVRMKRGELGVKPGKFIEVDMPVEQVNAGAGVKQLTFPPPNPAMFNIIEKLEEWATGASATGDILVGDVGGSNETATTTKIRSAMALSQMTILDQRYGRAHAEEVKKIARLNSRFLDEDTYFAVVEAGAVAPQDREHVGRTDYIEDTDITFTADPRLAPQPQRVEEAMKGLEIVKQLPPPLVPPHLLHAIAVDIFRAMDKPDWAEALGPPPPPMPPPGMAPPGMGPPGGGPGGPPGMEPPQVGPESPSMEGPPPLQLAPGRPTGEPPRA